MVEPANTVVDSEILQTHRLTESDGTESFASSGFLNMFGRDLERASVSVRADTEQDVMDDDESLVSGRSGASDVSGGGLYEEAQEEEPTPTVQLGTQTLRRGLESLDEVNLSEVWKIRGHLMKGVPKFMQGVYASAMRQALDFVSLGEDRGDEELQSRAWKLFFLLPRMFLFRPCRGGQVPKKTLMARLGLFQDGKWVELVEMSLVSSVQAVNVRARARRRSDGDDIQKRVRRAFHMVQLGEVSAGRQALEGASLAAGDQKTLNALRDPTRRPAVSRDSVPDDIAGLQPEEPFVLDQDMFLHNVRTARKGAAPGPSGMTADHMRPLVEHSGAARALSHGASLMAQARIPEEIMSAIRCGRMIALQKPDGGVRGIVVGDVFRRAVARTIAQQYVAKVEVATTPHQYALRTKAGCEIVAHILQVLTDLDPNATVVSVDGIGAYDLISRNSMLQGVRHMADGEQLLPFVRAMYGQPSTRLWEDDSGEAHTIPQGEGGEQGDPLMPLLFCLGQHQL